jgi:hypothetical protein
LGIVEDSKLEPEAGNGQLAIVVPTKNSTFDPKALFHHGTSNYGYDCSYKNNDKLFGQEDTVAWTTVIKEYF